tara:strand:+ start:9400 stop:9507 length:108 start_codon:yes stop_codon:yes gene_type:complete
MFLLQELMAIMAIKLKDILNRFIYALHGIEANYYF